MSLTDLLTKREKEIAKCVADGMNNIEIKEFLNISMPTVKSHLEHIYWKYHIECNDIKNYACMRVKVALQYLKDEGKLTMETVKISKNGATFEMPRENLKCFALYEALQRGIKSGPIHDEQTSIEYLNSIGIEVKLND